MTMAPSKPQFVYRLASRTEWSEALETGFVPLRAIDQEDGYIHLSTRDQLLETARRHFAGASDLLALEIPLKQIAAQVRFELAPKRGEKFPHLYAPLEASCVNSVFVLAPAGDGFAIGDAI